MIAYVNRDEHATLALVHCCIFCFLSVLMWLPYIGEIKCIYIKFTTTQHPATKTAHELTLYPGRT